MKRLALTLFLFLFLIPAFSQFIEESELQGIFVVQEGTMWGNGASFFDYNHDGWDDLTTADGTDFVRFYKNDGTGNLVEDDINLNFAFTGQIISVLWFDCENDGDEDLLVTQFGGRALIFENNGNFQFTETAISKGLQPGSYLYYGAAIADYDQDGFLDICIPKYYNPDVQQFPEYSTRLLHNDGDGTFTDVTVPANVLMPPRPCFQIVFFDYNEDGWLDMYWIIDRASWINELWENNGDGTFTNVSQTGGMNIAIDSMSGTVGDFDNDNDFDIYVSNTNNGNALLVHGENHVFSDQANQFGVAVYEISWGANWLDYENDGDLDLFVGTAAGANYTVSQNNFYIQNESGLFTEENENVGILGDIDPTFCNVIGDYNNDGFFDYYNNSNDPKPSRLWRNTATENHYLSVELQGTISNRNAIGTRVEFFYDGHQQSRFTHCGESYLAQNSGKKIVGLGDYNIVDSIVIHWPRGLVERYYNIPSNQQVKYIEGMSFETEYSFGSVDTTLCPSQTTILDAGPANSWLWSDGQTSRQIVVDSPGTFYCEMTHPFNFISTTEVLTFEIQQPPVMDVFVSNPTCYDFANGEVVLNILSDEEYTWTWNGSTIESTFISNLLEGLYVVDVTTTNGCSASNTIELISPSQIVGVFETIQPSCYDSNDGEVTEVSIEGGIAPYSWQILNGINGSLSAGQYQILVTDANDCEISYPTEIVSPAAINVSFEITAASENSLGSIEYNSNGGTGELILSVNNMTLPSEGVAELEAGEYSAVVYDENNCLYEFSFEIPLIVGLFENNILNSTFYPNPFTNQIKVQKKNHLLSEVIQVFNQQGQLIYFNLKCPAVISTTEWASGMYFITLDGKAFKLEKH